MSITKNQTKNQNKKMVKTIRMVKSTKSGSYKFIEKIISIENLDNFFV
ncbi:MAG: DUF4295 domain-containing protein [Candidatus Bostrichicola ureolyticus]|nr:MAG: DUF4295 domain-containing protein [Candidatus Bostrichicola ureolyticus]